MILHTDDATLQALTAAVLDHEYGYAHFTDSYIAISHKVIDLNLRTLSDAINDKLGHDLEASNELAALALALSPTSR